MNTLRPLVFAVATILVLGTGLTAAAQERHESAAAKINTSLTPKERGELTRQFVRKWGNYVQQIYGMDVHSWASRMVGTFATADPANFQQALRRSTFEGAMATLDGSGHKLSDDKVIDVLASNNGQVGPYALGDLDKDLVFTQLEPCRIVDTRSTAAGAIAGGTNRGFYAWGFSSYANQGGSNTNCGLGGQSPEAIVVNVTVVSPSATGYTTMYPANGTLPLAATMIYQAGMTLSNSATVKLGTSGVVDFRIFSEKTAQYVVDIVGYYDAPYATALDCTNTSGTSINLTAAARNGNASAPACPAGYTSVGVHLGANGDFQNLFTRLQGPFYAYMYYAGSTSAEALVYNRCCRVPGR